MSAIIQVDNVTKSYRVSSARPGILGALRALVRPERRTIAAVQDVSFRIPEGEIVGYLGLNGSGKSTTIKLLTGVLVPSSGAVEVAGRIPWKERTSLARDIGVVFGHRTSLWWDLPLADSFDLLRHLYDVRPADFQARMTRMKKVLELEPFWQTPVRQLSLGQRMRGELASAFLHQPRLLFLDEPTIGLDLLAKDRIREFILDMNREHGVTVMLTTHDLDDVEHLCSRVLLLQRGRMVFDGGVDALMQTHGHQRDLMVRFAAGTPPPPVDGARLVSQAGNRAIYRFSQKSCSPQELVKRVAEKAPFEETQLAPVGLESVLRSLYEGSAES